MRAKMEAVPSHRLLYILLLYTVGIVVVVVVVVVIVTKYSEEEGRASPAHSDWVHKAMSDEASSKTLLLGSYQPSRPTQLAAVQKSSREIRGFRQKTKEKTFSLYKIQQKIFFATHIHSLEERESPADTSDNVYRTRFSISKKIEKKEKKTLPSI